MVLRLNDQDKRRI